MRIPTRTAAALVALLTLLAAAGCYGDRGTSQRSEATPAAAPTPAAGAAAPEAAAEPAAGTPAGAPSVALESGHAPLFSRAPAGGASPHGDTGPHAGAITLSWDVPDHWVAETPRNPMRRAQYRLPGEGGAGDAECAVFYFGPGAGGDAQGNVARWVSMLTKPDGSPVEGKVSEQKVGSRLVTRVEAAGTYHAAAMSMGGEPPPPEPGYALLGAVVPGPDANWFFRCAGPEKTIAAQRAGFDALIASIREGSE